MKSLNVRFITYPMRGMSSTQAKMFKLSLAAPSTLNIKKKKKKKKINHNWRKLKTFTQLTIMMLIILRLNSKPVQKQSCFMNLLLFNNS